MRRIILSLLLLVIGATAFAQESFPINGVRDMRTGVYAFTNATIVQNEKTKIEKLNQTNNEQLKIDLNFLNYLKRSVFDNAEVIKQNKLK
jgi:hypothetical protein